MKPFKLTIVLLLLNTVGASLSCGADDCCARHVRPQDQVWLISSRQLGCPIGGQRDVQLGVQIHDGEAGWSPSSLDEFFAPSPGGADPIVLIHIHGNRKDTGDALSDGWMAYRRLVAGTNPDRAVKFVIWSWPSQRQRRGLHDARVKADRSDVDAYYLGWFLSRFDARVPVSLVGHSLGARVILGALHVSTGGRLIGRQLDLPPDRPISRVRVVLLAAAEHNHWLLPGHKHDHAYLRINRMLVLYNSCDPVLHWYRLIDKYSRNDAMGYTGAVGLNRLADGGARIAQSNVRCRIGCTHSVDEYFCSKALIDRMSEYVFWQPLDAD